MATEVKHFYVDWADGRDRSVVELTVKDSDGKIHIFKFPDKAKLAELIWALDVCVCYSDKDGEGKIIVEKSKYVIGFCSACNKNVKKKDGFFVTFGRKNKKTIGLCTACLKKTRKVLKEVEV
jgi:hypothetical protein